MATSLESKVPVKFDVVCLEVVLNSKVLNCWGVGKAGELEIFDEFTK